MVDMAFLSAKKKIRLPKYLYEEGMYFLYPDSNDNNSVKQYFLSSDKVLERDDNFYYFKFPFSIRKVSEVSN